MNLLAQELNLFVNSAAFSRYHARNHQLTLSRQSSRCYYSRALLIPSNLLLTCNSVGVVIWGWYEWPLWWQTVFFRRGVAVIIHISYILNIQLTLMATIDFLWGYNLTAWYNYRTKWAWIIKYIGTTRRLCLYLTIVTISDVSMDKLIRRHSRLTTADILRNNMLL